MRGVRNLGEIQGSNFSSIAGVGMNKMMGVDRCAEHKNHAFLYSQKKSVNRPLKGEAESGWFALYPHGF